MLAGLQWDDQSMNRNTITVVIGVLAVAVAVLGYQLYQERQKPKGVEISIGDRGISIDKK
jgi:predicted negative regulator of RcsB-dependent stress response